MAAMFSLTVTWLHLDIIVKHSRDEWAVGCLIALGRHITTHTAGPAHWSDSQLSLSLSARDIINALKGL